MANETSAAFRGQSQLSGGAEADYQSFSAALGSSARGRAFLQEFARRNRHADTEVVLAALARFELAARRQNSAPEAERMRQDLRALLDTIRSARPQIDLSPGAIRAATLSSLIEFVQARLEGLIAPGPLGALAEVPQSDQPELPIPRPGASAQRSIALVQAVTPPLPEAKRAPISREAENFALELDPRVGPVFGESNEPLRAAEIIPGIDFVDGLFAPKQLAQDQATDATSGPGSIELWGMPAEAEAKTEATPPVATEAVSTEMTQDIPPVKARETAQEVAQEIAKEIADEITQELAQNVTPEMVEEIAIAVAQEIEHTAVPAIDAPAASDIVQTDNQENRQEAEQEIGLETVNASIEDKLQEDILQEDAAQAVQGPLQEAPQETVQETIQETVEEIVEATAEEAVPQNGQTDASAHGAAHGSAQSSSLADPNAASITAVGTSEFLRTVTPEFGPLLPVQTTVVKGAATPAAKSVVDAKPAINPKPAVDPLAAIMSLSEEERIALFT